MTPVDQRSLWTPTQPGDCLNACLASLLDLPYEEVPFFNKIAREGGPPYFTQLWDFLESRGYEFQGSFYPEAQVLDCFPFVEIFNNWHVLPSLSPGVNGFYLAGGPSPRGPQVPGGHQIVIRADGSLAHDPHPSREGVVRITDVFLIEPKA
jgi:hypothetical protein